MDRTTVSRGWRWGVAALIAALAVAGCGEQRAPLSGSIRIDGSRTLAPLTQAVAKRFMAENPRVHVAVAASGTDAGFVKLCREEADAGDASDAVGPRARAACERAGVAAQPIVVADDAAILMVNRGNPVSCLTTAQVFQIWRGGSEVTESWSQVAGLEPRYRGDFVPWGPGTETETFASFNEAVTAAERAGYRDYNNELERESDVVAGVASQAGANGYVDYPVYRQHPGTVKALEIDSGSGCVAPTPQTIADGTFRPLARKLVVYTSAKALARPAMDAFLRFYLDNVRTIAPAVGLVAPTPGQVRASKAEVARAASGATAG